MQPPPPPPPSSPTNLATTHTLYLIRHGARYDYASSSRWAALSKLPEVVPTDPPLSAFGLHQASRTAESMADHIESDLAQSPSSTLSVFSSLYLRVVQTALPLVHLLQSSLTSLSPSTCNDGVLKIELGLCEFGHCYNTLPSPSARSQMFPEIDLEYEPLVELGEMDWKEEEGGREGGVDYMRRVGKLSER